MEIMGVLETIKTAMDGEAKALTRSPQTAQKSVIQYSEMSLTASLPKWVRLVDLDAQGVFYPGEVQPGQGDVLRQAAAVHRAALAPIGQEGAEAMLKHLRLVTKLNNESEFEKRVTLKSLVKSLQDVPADILTDALAAFVNTMGDRWFPKSAGEIRAFTNPAITRRRLRVTRLLKLAEISDNTPDMAKIKDSWDEPIPLHEVDAENETMKMLGLKTRYNPQTGVAFTLKLGDVDPCVPREEISQ